MSEKMGLPLVSIVTPAYNQSDFLAETIDSVLAQDYQNLEYIVIDDGSTDATPGIIRGYGDRIVSFSHSNVGQAATLNKGWSMSAGSIIGYLSSDDKLHPSAISTLVKVLQNNPAALVAYCDFELIDSSGKLIREVRTEHYSASRLQRDLVCQPGPGALFHKTALLSGGWDSRLRQIPDFEFWLRLSRRGDFVRVPESLAAYRIHDDSASLRPVSFERSMEIVETMISYWRGASSSSSKRSISNAYLIAAKSHAQSGRPGAAFKNFRVAATHRPAALLSPSAWRWLLSGFLRRRLYRNLLSVKP